MDINYSTRRLEKLCNDSRLATKKMGANQAKKLRSRLDDLAAASRLADMRFLPGRCHELTGTLSKTLSLDLEHPNRLLFVSQEQPPPSKSDGGLDWGAIEAVEITSIEDTHG